MLASWQQPSLGPARPLTVTLAPRAQLGARPDPGGGSSAWLGTRGGGSRRTGRCGRDGGQLLIWETCPPLLASETKAPGPSPGTKCPAHGHGQLLGTVTLCASWAGSAPPSACGGSTVSLKPGSLFIPRVAWLGASPPALADCPPPLLLPGALPLAPPRLPPGSHQQPGAGTWCLRSYSSLALEALGREQAGAASVSPVAASQSFACCAVFSSPPCTGLWLRSGPIRAAMGCRTAGH